MINRALRLIRQYHELSVTKLAEELNIPKQYLDGIEAGTKPVNNDILEKYSTKFDIPISSLVMFSAQITNEKKLAKRLRNSLAGKILDVAEWAMSKNEKIEA
ncbi:helix-turn-helix domain-containing protein [Vibrio crassostreae]|uniref:helix-turn-helix domain-containing protein n=1 Tax=Vibrio crassostreae TaxID=246167 RepID=UPI002FE26396